MERSGFLWVDYAILGSSLCVSLSIGLYFGWRQKDSLDSGGVESLLGGGHMSLLPTAASLLASFLSGILILGVPAELYTHGFGALVYLLSCNVTLLIVAVVLLPVLCRLKSISLYQYLEERFESAFLRYLAATVFVLNSLIYLAIVLYAPAVALNAATRQPLWVFVVSVGLVSTLYTSVGGLRAVVWTDTFQAGLMLAGLLALVFKVAAKVNVLDAFAYALSRGHLGMAVQWGPDPAQYMTVWVAVAGGTSFWLGQYGINQMAMQRYQCLGSLYRARQLVALTAVGYTILICIACLVGLLMISYFRSCDPLRFVEASSPDQLVMLMVERSLGGVPGLGGLFLACLCSGTLSSISSGLNSLAAVVWEDFLGAWCGRRFPALRTGRAIALISLVLGVAVTGASFVCNSLGGLIRTATKLLGALSGPISGLFLLGICVPRAGKTPATISVLCSLVLSVSMSLGSSLYRPYKHFRIPVSPDNGTFCEGLDNVTVRPQHYLDKYGDQSVLWIFRVADWVYPFIGIATTMGIGAVLSLCPATHRRRQTSSTIKMLEMVPVDESDDIVRKYRPQSTN